MLPIVAEISEEVQNICETLAGDASVSIGDVEEKVSAATASWAQRLSEGILCEIANAPDVSSKPVVCQVCQGQSRRYRQRSRRFTTLCGVVRLSRWEYKCRCGHIQVPWDAKQPLLGKYTQKVAAVMMRLAAQLDYRAAAAELKHQGIEVSHTTLHAKVQAWSEGESVSDYVDKTSVDVGERWYVSCDGCHTNSPDGYKEVKVGSIGKDYPHQNATSVMKIRASSLRYVASRSPAEAFGRQLTALATQMGIYQDEETLDTEEVVVIGDGAAWIWNLADESFPNATEIIDYMHAKRHLYDLAKQAFGEEDRESIETWVSAIETPLYAGETSEVIAGIKALGKQYPQMLEAIKTQVGYFQKHAHRMQYETFKAKGYQIGSGVIESACKHVVAQRCKQAGMRWSEPGINAILFWRCLLKNQSFEKYWQTQLQEAA